MEKILALAKKAAEKAEVFSYASQSTPIRFEANRLKHIQTKESTGTALRLIKGGRIGFAQASGDFDPANLVAMALETSKFGAEAKFEFPGAGKYPQVDIFDQATKKLSMEDMIQDCQQLIDVIRRHTPEILCEAYMGKGIATTMIINSNGGEAGYTKSYFSINLEGIIVKDNEMLFVGDGMSSCQPIRDFNPVADEVIMQLEMAKDKADVVAGMMPVIFRPQGVASALVSPLAAAFNGKLVFNGASPLKEKMGKKVFDTQFSVWDDATIPYQVGSAPCDDEGIPSRRTALIEKGVVSHFYYDLQSAGLANTTSTGNGSRRGGLPSPAPNSLVFSDGKISFADMVKGIKQGLIVYQLMGADQGNILNGDFSGNVLLGYKIENGQIVGRVKDTMVSGNIYQILKELQALGSDARWVDGFLYSPSICCSSLPVATKGG